MSTITLSSSYVLVRCGHEYSNGAVCDITFGMPRALHTETQDSGNTWYCPRGHPRVWLGETTQARLEHALARATHLEDQLIATEVDAERTRQKLARERYRISIGVCPCCNRTFENIARHMSTQHPEYTAPMGPKVPLNTCSCGDTFETFRGLRAHQGHTGQDLTSKSRIRRHATVV